MGIISTLQGVLALHRIAHRAGMTDDYGFAVVKRVLDAAAIEGYLRVRPAPPAATAAEEPSPGGSTAYGAREEAAAGAREAAMKVKRVRAMVRIPLWLRIRYGWFRFRLGRRGRAIADIVNAQVEKEFLGL